MRNLTLILKVLASSAALTTLVACEEIVPQEHAAPTRLSTSTGASTVNVDPPKVESPKADPPVAVAAPQGVVEAPPPRSDAAADDSELKANELITGARAALSGGELDRALKLAKLATKRAPNRSTSWNTLGRVQLRRGEKQDAIATFERAVELNPSSSYAQNNLGLALLYAGRYDDAVDALEEATELEPVEGYMWNNLGMAYEHLDRLDDARSAYRQASALAGKRASSNLARLTGVKKIYRTAKVDVVERDHDHDEELDLPGISAPASSDHDGGGAQ